MAKIAVILSGCGVFDGSEVREAVLTLNAISELGQEPVFMAPNVQQMHVINHQSGQVEEGEVRNVMEESARIARGAVLDLADANPDDYDAVLIPGGFGAAKNLSTFPIAGSEGTLNESLRMFLQKVHAASKPIGAMCIAPVLLGLLKKEAGLEGSPQLTIGCDASTAEALQALGCQHNTCKPQEVCVDERFRFVTAPAYMYDDAPIHEIGAGIRKLVQKVVEWTQ